MDLLLKNKLYQLHEVASTHTLFFSNYITIEEIKKEIKKN